MALYRCAACGSPNVLTDTQKEGYDYVKGAIGTVVLGSGGAVAGVNGKNKQVFKCPDCGMTLTYAMPDELRELIDIGVMSVKARDNLTLRGMPIEWEFLKNKYKNIESGIGDEIEKAKRDEFSFDFMSDEGKLLLEEARPLFESAKISFKQQFEARQKEEAEKVTRDLLNCENVIKNLESELEGLKTELNTLGFFQIGKKSELKQRIEAKESELEKNLVCAQELEKRVGMEPKKARDLEVEVYAALKAIGHKAIAKQVNQARCFYTNTDYPERYEMGVRASLHILWMDGFISRVGEIYLDNSKCVFIYC